MGIPQESNAVFYHPLDDLTESLYTQAWNGTGESFGTGKVANALTDGLVEASTPGVYATGVSATHLAFAAWTRSPGPSPFSGPPAQFFDETDRAYAMAMGVPASALGGLT